MLMYLCTVLLRGNVWENQAVWGVSVKCHVACNLSLRGHKVPTKRLSKRLNHHIFMEILKIWDRLLSLPAWISRTQPLNTFPNRLGWLGWPDHQTKPHAELLKCEHSVTLGTRLELFLLLIWAQGLVGLWDLHCAPSREYRTTLCTTDLHCAPPFHQPALCTMVHKRDLCPSDGLPPTFFIFYAFDGSQATCPKWTLFVRIWWGTRTYKHTQLVHKHITRTYINVVFLWLTTDMQIKVHNVLLYRCILWWCTT